MNIVVLIRLSNNLFKEEFNPLFWAKHLKSKYGGKINVFAMDSSINQQLYKKCLGYDVDEMFLLSDSNFAGADVLATSRVITRAIQLYSNDYDVILAGSSSTFGETGLVPISVARLLNIQARSNVVDVEIENINTVYIEENYDVFTQKTKEKCPVLISLSNAVDNNMYKNLKPTLFDIMNANNKKVNILNIMNLDINPNECGVLGSYTRVTETKKIVSNRKHRLIENCNINEIDYLNMQIKKVRE